MFSKYDFNLIREAVIDFFTKILQNENAKQLVEKAKSVNEIEEILQNNSLPLTEKHLKSFKVLIKDRLKQNDYYGPVTKKVFENIIDSNIHPYHMVGYIEAYALTNDLTK